MDVGAFFYDDHSRSRISSTFPSQSYSMHMMATRRALSNSVEHVNFTLRHAIHHQIITIPTVTSLVNGSGYRSVNALQFANNFQGLNIEDPEMAVTGASDSLSDAGGRASYHIRVGR